MDHKSRVSPPPVNPHGGPAGPQGQRPPGTPGYPYPAPMEQQQQLQPEPPPEHTYPCGCAWPGTHKADCMWSLWEQMRDNHLQTRDLMKKFMMQANTMQEASREGVKCQCPASCHGTDLGQAMGLQQMEGVTIPWGTSADPMSALVLGGAVAGGGMGVPQQQDYTVENEARKLMEDQKRIKNMWVQFLNIFDMALDMANDMSKDRWEQNRRRKERQRLEREQRLEELRKERLERQKGSKPEPPADTDKNKDSPDHKTDSEKDKPKEKDDKPKDDKTKPVEKENEDKKEEEKTPVEKEETPAEEEQTPADEGEEGEEGG